MLPRVKNFTQFEQRMSPNGASISFEFTAEYENTVSYLEEKDYIETS